MLTHDTETSKPVLALSGRRSSPCDHPNVETSPGGSVNGVSKIPAGDSR